MKDYYHILKPDVTVLYSNPLVIFNIYTNKGTDIKKIYVLNTPKKHNF